MLEALAGRLSARSPAHACADTPSAATALKSTDSMIRRRPVMAPAYAARQNCSLQLDTAVPFVPEWTPETVRALAPLTRRAG